MPTPEIQARELIDEQLVAADLIIQNYKQRSLDAVCRMDAGSPLVVFNC